MIFPYWRIQFTFPYWREQFPSRDSPSHRNGTVIWINDQSMSLAPDPPMKWQLSTTKKGLTSTWPPTLGFIWQSLTSTSWPTCTSRQWQITRMEEWRDGSKVGSKYTLQLLFGPRSTFWLYTVLAFLFLLVSQSVFRIGQSSIMKIRY